MSQHISEEEQVKDVILIRLVDVNKRVIYSVNFLPVYTIQAGVTCNKLVTKKASVVLMVELILFSMLFTFCIYMRDMKIRYIRQTNMC
jgi:hypothetical protein